MDSKIKKSFGRIREELKVVNDLKPDRTPAYARTYGAWYDSKNGVFYHTTSTLTHYIIMNQIMTRQGIYSPTYTNMFRLGFLRTVWAGNHYLDVEGTKKTLKKTLKMIKEIAADGNYKKVNIDMVATSVNALKTVTFDLTNPVQEKKFRNFSV